MSKNVGRPPRRAPIPEKAEEKRPSVFERLGHRSHRDTAPPPSSFPQDVHGGARWPGPDGHSSRDPRSRGLPPPDSVKHRTPSFSPPVIKGPHGKEVKVSGSMLTSKKNAKDGSKQKSPRSEAKRSNAGKKNKKKRSNKLGDGGKKSSEKKKRKDKTSSVSSGGDSSDDSNSSSSSKTSSSSSSSSSNSSSSDSSGPSIKLKSEKSKSKKILKTDKKIPSNKPSSSRSSSSGMDSSSMALKRGPVPIDLREKLNARSPSGIREPSYMSKPKLGEPPRVKPYNRGPSPLMDDRYSVKKRPHPEGSYQMDDMKRRRGISPSPSSDKYRMPPDESPHHHHRRAPPQLQDIPPRRDRSPQDSFHTKNPYQPQRGAPPLMRRPDTRRPERPDFRNERDRRNSPFSQQQPPKADFDNRRREPVNDYSRDNRSRERLAPTRPPMDNRQDRDRMHNMDNRNPPHDYQHNQQRRPQTQRLPFNQPEHGRMGNYREPPPTYDRDRQKFPQEEKRQPLLPKSKEALAERYENEQMKNKSGYIDKWVDETLRTTQRQVVTTVVDVRSPQFSAHSAKSNSIASSSEDRSKLEDLNKKPIDEVENLSDISDDADELLNTAVDSPPDSGTAAEVESKTPKAVAESPRKEPAVLLEKPTTEISVSMKKRTASVDTAPSMLSQERLSVKARTTRDGKSLPSQSQTDDDILETMDFEEISDDELGEVENKVHIVDALGVDWASLVCQEKKNDSLNLGSESKSTSSARKRWTPVNVLTSIGISKSLAGETLFNKIHELKRLQDSEGNTEDIENAHNKSSPSDSVVLEKLGLGPNSRALSSRRDMAVRRHFLGLSPKNLLSMDVIRSNAASTTPPEVDSVGELFKMSISLLKNSKTVSASL